MPVFPANILTLRATAAVEDDTEDSGVKGKSARLPCASQNTINHSHETNDGNDLDAGEDKFRLAVASDAEQVDRDNHNIEDSDEDSS